MDAGKCAGSAAPVEMRQMLVLLCVAVLVLLIVIPEH